jgi:hypothetical protein
LELLIQMLQAQMKKKSKPFLLLPNSLLTKTRVNLKEMDNRNRLRRRKRRRTRRES